VLVIVAPGKVLSQPRAAALPLAWRCLPDSRQEGWDEAPALRFPLPCFTPFFPRPRSGLCAVGQPPSAPRGTKTLPDV